MAECFKCGKEESSTRFFDVISDEGVVKICADCQFEEEMPVLRKPTTVQLKEAEVGGTVYDRLANLAGLNGKEHRKKFHSEEMKKKEDLKNKDVSLRDLVDKNFQKKEDAKSVEEMPKLDLIHNYHWVIMRYRRKKKLTQAQLAKEIGESDAAVKMIEQGSLPEDAHRLVKKLEAFLGIILASGKTRSEFDSKPGKVGFDDVTTKELTISDLRDMKAQHDTDEMLFEMKEEEDLNVEGKMGFGEKIKSIFSRKPDVEDEVIDLGRAEDLDVEEKPPKDDLTEEEIDDFVWRK